MSLTSQVNGEASVWVGLGSSYAYEELGISIDGIEINENFHTEAIKTDTFGGAVSWDEQYFLIDATIRCQLIVFDPNVIIQVQSRGYGLSAGVMWAAGTPLVAAGITFPVVIKSTPSGSGVIGGAPCRKYPNCYCVEAYTVKVGTRATVANVTFKALPTQQTGSSSGATLMLFACS